MKTSPILLAIALFVQPAAAQLKDKRSEATDAIFSRYDTVQTTGISIMVIQKGDILYERAFGLAEISSGQKATPATNYRIASVTKPFTAMAVMIIKNDERNIFTCFLGNARNRLWLRLAYRK